MDTAAGSRGKPLPSFPFPQSNTLVGVGDLLAVDEVAPTPRPPRVVLQALLVISLLCLTVAGL